MINKKITIIDYGYYTGLAEVLAPAVKEVVYAPPWHAYNPTPDKASIGMGLPGVHHAEEYDEHLDSSDAIIFPDVGDWAKQIREANHGKAVFGMRKAEELELNRLKLKQELDKRKLPGPKYWVFYGINELSAFLKKKSGVWVKIFSKFRGIRETFFHDTWEDSEQIIDQMAYMLGVQRNTFCFIVEEPYGVCEGGSDYFISNGIYLPKALMGFEEKNEAYLCKVVAMDDMPQPIKGVHDAFADYYKETKPCGVASDEIRAEEGKPKTGYFLDATKRFGDPPFGIMCRIWKNFPEIVMAVANGQYIVPEESAKYGAMVVLKSLDAMCEVVPVEVEKEAAPWVSFRRSCFQEGKRQIIPMDDDEIIGSAVGIANTKEEAAALAIKRAAMVKCPGLYYNASVFDNEIPATLELAEKCGFGEF